MHTKIIDPNLRIIDVNQNRLREALRLIEDVARFAVDNEILTRQIKEFRHRIRGICRDEVVLHRDSESDKGHDIYTEAEMSRRNIKDMVVASFKRAQESLRVLEELSKISSRSDAINYKHLRFDLYNIEKLFIETVLPFFRKILSEPLLYLVLSVDHCLLDPFQTAEKAVLAGAGAVQLRSKTLNDKEMIRLGGKLKSLCERNNALFIVNDRPDLVVILGADGLHLGQDDVDPMNARKIVGTEIMIGLSCHNDEQLAAAQNEDIDYTGFGPVFATDTKENHDPVTGLSPEMFRSKFPVVAIGGITPENAWQIREAGCRRIAVVTGITKADDIEGAVKKYMEVL